MPRTTKARTKTRLHKLRKNKERKGNRTKIIPRAIKTAVRNPVKRSRKDPKTPKAIRRRRKKTKGRAKERKQRKRNPTTRTPVKPTPTARPSRERKTRVL